MVAQNNTSNTHPKDESEGKASYLKGEIKKESSILAQSNGHKEDLNIYIKEIKQNSENLHYPYLILSNGEVVGCRTMTLRAVYGESLGVGSLWNPTKEFNYEKEMARIELFPLLIPALKEAVVYSKLSLKHKGYFSICKDYDLIKELKGLVEGEAQALINESELSKEDQTDLNVLKTTQGRVKRKRVRITEQNFKDICQSCKHQRVEHRNNDIRGNYFCHSFDKKYCGCSQFEEVRR